MDCTFCNKSFVTSYVLQRHQKTSKSCIKKQEENGIVKKDPEFVCTHCSKCLTTKWSLTNHYKICKIIKKQKERELELKINNLEQKTEDKIEQITSDFRNHKEEIEYEYKKTKEEIEYEYKKTKEELKKKDDEINLLLEKLNKTPTKITKIKNNTNNTNNIETNIEQQNITIYQIMTPENVQAFFKNNYNLDTLLGGQKALARFVNDGFLKEAEEPLYLCGDRSRQKFYIVKDGKKKEDPDCNEIIELTSAGMPHVQDVYENALFSTLPDQVTEDDVQDNYEQIMTINDQRSDFKSELSKVVSSISTDVMHVKKNDIKAMTDALKERSRRLGLLDRVKPKSSTDKNGDEEEEPVRRPDILGIPPGKLMVYRDRYRKDGAIKGPPSIMKQIEESEEAKREYMAYLES
jgi:hypothetical protein